MKFKFSLEDLYGWIEKAYLSVKSSVIINGFVKAGYIEGAKLNQKDLKICDLM